METSGAAQVVLSVTREKVELKPKSTAEPIVMPSNRATVVDCLVFSSRSSMRRSGSGSGSGSRSRRRRRSRSRSRSRSN